MLASSKLLKEFLVLLDPTAETSTLQAIREIVCLLTEPRVHGGAARLFELKKFLNHNIPCVGNGRRPDERLWPCYLRDDAGA